MKLASIDARPQNHQELRHCWNMGSEHSSDQACALPWSSAAARAADDPMSNIE
jgi:hypothetical protein